MRRGLLITLFLLAWAPFPAGGTGGSAVLVPVKGAIGPATADWVERSLERAVEQGARLVILQLDTPGGLDASMREIVKAILAAPVPVVGFVAPAGARAASAGTYILYACHVAAMAPGTNLGAATPIPLGGRPPAPLPAGRPGKEEKEHQEKEGTRPEQALDRKVVNDAVAYLRSLAELRGRNAEWAETAVREGASLPARDALERGVIDLLARDPGELLGRLEGWHLSLGGREVELETEALVLERAEPDWRSRLLAVISNPNIAYLLLIIGLYGLIFEFSSPGAVIPGVVGGIALLLALFALQVLPISWTGLGLILLGVALMVAEAFVPSFGALGIGGVVAFVIGSILLIDVDQPGYGIDPWLIGAVSLFSGLFFVLVIGMAVKSARKPGVTGRGELIGARGVALESFTGEGRVRVHGETWKAVTRTPLERGQAVRVTGADGLVLEVEPEALKLEEVSTT